MLYCKLSPTPFQLGFFISTTCASFAMDSTLYKQLVGSLLYQHTHISIYPFQLDLSLDYHIIQMRFIDKIPNVS